MKEVKIHIPTMEYGFIEVVAEIESADEAVVLHDELKLLVSDRGELTQSEWVKVREKMLMTGECDPNIQLTKAQQFWINETKKTLRAIKNKEN